MKKIVLAAAIALAGCSSNEPAPRPSPSPAAAPVTSGASTAHEAPVTVGSVVPWGDLEAMKKLQGLDGATHARPSIEWPKEDDVLANGSGAVKYSVAGFELDPKAGDGCALVLDDRDAVLDFDHATTLEQLNGGAPVAEGTHLLTVFPARRCGLALKNDGSCAQVRFHVKSKKGKVPGPSDEQLIYFQPHGGAWPRIPGSTLDIPCDFYVLNMEMDKEHFLKLVDVIVTIDSPDGKHEKIKSNYWRPLIVLHDPKPGKYKVKLSLEERDDGDPVDGPFLETTRELTVE